MLETYLDMLELGYFEMDVAFEGLADENVWKRPADGLLSIGEIAGHLCYSEATRLGSIGKPGPQVSSPLIDSRFAYYPNIIASSPSAEHLTMTANAVLGEVMRVHNESVAIFRERNPDIDSNVDGWHEELTHRENLKYMIFHIAYHTGQIYTTRHLLGEETVDN